jgi:hypothetical protein
LCPITLVNPMISPDSLSVKTGHVAHAWSTRRRGTGSRAPMKAAAFSKPPVYRASEWIWPPRHTSGISINSRIFPDRFFRSNALVSRNAVRRGRARAQRSAVGPGSSRRRLYARRGARTPSWRIRRLEPAAIFHRIVNLSLIFLSDSLSHPVRAPNAVTDMRSTPRGFSWASTGSTSARAYRSASGH